MRFIMTSAIEGGRQGLISVIEGGGEGGGKPPQEGARLDNKVINVALEVLKVCIGLREFSNVYRNDALPIELIDNRHQDTPRYERMQQGFNSVKERVVELSKADPRIRILFDLMVETFTNYDE
jgi:hypothetical protein